MNQKHMKLLGPTFVAFEAFMHTYLVFYLVVEGANLPVIGFTLFELVMFLYLLGENRLRDQSGAS